MKLPHGDRAIVPEEKLTRYLLDESHPEGGSKAVLFRRLLGFTLENPEPLRQALLEAAIRADVISHTSGQHGTRYRLDSVWTGRAGEYTVRSVWIVRPDDERPSLVTAYVL